MESMKSRGYRDVDSALRRVIRLHALGRIGEDDTYYIADRLRQVMARVTEMREEGKDGEEIGGE